MPSPIISKKVVQKRASCGGPSDPSPASPLCSGEPRHETHELLSQIKKRHLKEASGSVVDFKPAARGTRSLTGMRADGRRSLVHRCLYRHGVPSSQPWQARMAFHSRRRLVPFRGAWATVDGCGTERQSRSKRYILSELLRRRFPPHATSLHLQHREPATTNRLPAPPSGQTDPRSNRTQTVRKAVSDRYPPK